MLRAGNAIRSAIFRSIRMDLKAEILKLIDGSPKIREVLW